MSGFPFRDRRFAQGSGFLLQVNSAAEAAAFSHSVTVCSTASMTQRKVPRSFADEVTRKRSGLDMAPSGPGLATGPGGVRDGVLLACARTAVGAAASTQAMAAP